MKDYIDAGFDAHWSDHLAAATGLPRPPFTAAVMVEHAARTLYVSGQAYPRFAEAEAAPPASEVDIATQAQGALSNIATIVESAGGRIEDIVKVTIYSTRIDQQARVNDVYGKFFGDHRPARTHVEVSRLAGQDLLIEIDAIAVIDDPGANTSL